MWIRHVTSRLVISHNWMSRFFYFSGKKIAPEANALTANGVWFATLNCTYMNESCHTYEWVMSHIWLRHVTHMTEACHTCDWGMSHIWRSHVTHVNEACHTYECTHEHSSGFAMGWLRLIGSIKSQVSFAKEPYKGDYILQKRPII